MHHSIKALILKHFIILGDFKYYTTQISGSLKINFHVKYIQQFSYSIISGVKCVIRENECQKRSRYPTHRDIEF